MDLIPLLQSYPILNSFASQLTFRDLLSLSRTSSQYRATLHGFTNLVPRPNTVSGSTIRSDLLIGAADTPLWKRLKRFSQIECSEPRHTKGKDPRGCRMCSMPVCTACIVKASFNKTDENTFGNRRRQLCKDCFTSGNPHRERLRFAGDRSISIPYARTTLCRCTARDGYLCSKCKEEHNRDPHSTKCFGHNCPNIIQSEEEGIRICLWCNLVLPGPRRRDRESKYPAEESYNTASDWGRQNGPFEVPFRRESQSSNDVTGNGMRRVTSFGDQRYSGLPLAFRNFGLSPPPQMPPPTEDAPAYEAHHGDLDITALAETSQEPGTLVGEMTDEAYHEPGQEVPVSSSTSHS